MAPYLGPQEPASQVTLERYFLATNFISGIGYGAQGVLYCICCRYLWKQRKARRVNKFMLAYITLLFLISSLSQVAQAHNTQLVFIDNRNSPGGPWEYYTANLGGTANVVGQIPTVALLFLSELFMVWRCWVVWRSVGQQAAYAVAFFPVLMLIASLIAAVIYFVTIMHPGSLIAGAHTTAWILTYYTLMLSSNVIATVLILVRLIAHRREVRKTLPSTHGGEYTSIISMMIESAAFYSIIGASCLIVTGLGSPVAQPFISATISTQADGGWKQISGYLIISRLAHGHGWQTNTMSVHSKIVIRRNMSASDTQMGDEERVSVLLASRPSEAGTRLELRCTCTPWCWPHIATKYGGEC
ncbi:hypothetical protein BD779DRAFT_1469460 [Infundibulicybe gibba]|nr:hypothetical protein BD779DRAFT_1469460 [Infundibulicybe gibba]